MFIGQKGKSIKLYLAAIIFLSFGLYLIFDQFLFITGKEIVKSWYHGELVSLQEGQILPAIAKNQSVFNKSPFIRSVVVVDSKEPNRNLFSVGVQTFKVTDELLESSAKNDDTVMGHREGFLSMNVVAKIPGANNLHIIYEISSRFLIWSYFGCVAVGILFISYLIGITVQIGNQERKKRDELRSSLIRRLSHDINSPILALSAISLQVGKLDRTLHIRIERVTESIRRLFAQTDKVDKEILRFDVHELGKESAEFAIDRDVETVPLVPILIDFVNQKRAEYSVGLPVEIKLHLFTQEIGSLARINVDEFKRHFSNLLKNSVEAGAKTIIIQLQTIFDTLEIVVSDDGNGIPPALISNLGVKGFSHGKSGGKGLGLYYAIATFKFWDGSISIDSNLSEGTRITMKLPSRSSPQWYLKSDLLKTGKKLILVDDDISMIDRWVNQHNLRAGDYVSFNSGVDFKKWFLDGGQFEENLQFVFDFHLENDSSGLDIIEEFGIEGESVLVTSAYFDPEIMQKAEKLKVPILPKILVGAFDLKESNL